MATHSNDMTKAAARWVWLRMLPAGALAMVAVALASFDVAASSGHSCVSTCQNQWIADGGQCVGRDQACLDVARAKYDACVVACTTPQRTTTTTRPRPTTTTTTTTRPRPTSTTTTLGEPSTTTTTLGDPPSSSTTTTTTRPSRPTTTTTTRPSRPSTTTTAPSPITTTTTSTAPTLPRTTTTVASSTTTTTLVPAFSPSTGACIKQATADKKICLVSASALECEAEYETAFASCFAPGKGVTCAASCLAKKTKCTSKTGGSSSRSTCVKGCQNQWVDAGARCGGADQACLTAARAAYDACVVGCANPATVDCRSAFVACLTKCPNL